MNSMICDITKGRLQLGFLIEFFCFFISGETQIFMTLLSYGLVENLINIQLDCYLLSSDELHDRV